MGVDASAVARVLGIETQFQRRSGGGVFLPMRIYVVGQGATASTYSSAKFQATNHAAVGDTVGYGSPLHRVARRLFPDNGDGVGSIPVTFAPLQDDGSGVAAVGDITVTGTATAAAAVTVKISETRSEAIAIAVGDDSAAVSAKITAAVNAVLEMPAVAATAITPDRSEFTVKWQGESGNAVYVEVVGNAPGLTFAVTQPVGGLNNPSDSDVTTALNLMGNVWEPLVLNCLDIDDTDVLTAINTHGEGRWGTLVKKPYVAFTGVTDTTVANAIAVSDARKTDRINSQLVGPDSKELPLDVAARQLARIARLANNDPARDYAGANAATGLVPGADENQWNYVQRDQAVKGGSSTVEIIDSEIHISDVVTFYHPSGVPTPPYRYVVDIVKVMNALFNLEINFNTKAWNGAPMIPDGQATVSRSAKTPSMAKQVMFGVVDFLAANAIISDPDASKAAITSAISATNPKRLDDVMPILVSGNVNIHSIDLLWGFYYGSVLAA